MGALRSLTPDEHIQALRILLRGADFVRTTPATLEHSRGLAIMLGDLLEEDFPNHKERRTARLMAVSELLETQLLESFNDLNSTQCATIFSYLNSLVQQRNSKGAAAILTRLARSFESSASVREVGV